MTGVDLIPPEFCGVGRLFPLPNLVMFPHAVQPLRVFEPRNVRMLEDALAADRLLTMAVLQPGWEANYEHPPRVYPVVCIGRVVSHHRAADGSYTLLLAGAARARIMQELTDDLPYRRAELERLSDIVETSGSVADQRLRALLLKAVQLNGLAPLDPSDNADPTARQLLQDQVDLGTLTDLIAHAAPLTAAVKLKLLAECSVAARVEQICGALERLHRVGDAQPASAAFPPTFSDN